MKNFIIINKMKKNTFSRNAAIMIVACLAVFLIFTSCDEKIKEEPGEEPGGNKGTAATDPHRYDTSAKTVSIEYMGKTISCQVINGKVVFQGDMVLGTEESISKTNPMRSAEQRGIRLWDEGKLYYCISDGFAYKSDVKTAIEHISKNTNIKFVELKTPEALEYRKKSYINFMTEPGKTWSYVGMLTTAEIESYKLDAQNLSVGWSESGAVVHELGHALGLIHEHSRSDRDDYIKIDTSNIEKKVLDDPTQKQSLDHNTFAKIEMGQHTTPIRIIPFPIGQTFRIIPCGLITKMGNCF